MLRIRWTDAADDPAELHGWRQPSLILATLFLNFFFWFVPADHFGFDSRAVLLLSLAALSALACLFFFGPAFAAQESRRTLFEVADASFGVIPGFGFRLGCAALCLLLIAGVAGVWVYELTRFLFNRYLSVVESDILAGLFILLLFGTGLQSLEASAKLATFTNKLGIALLIAAAIRVRENLALPGSGSESLASVVSDVCGIANPLMIIGPLALLAANFGCRSRTRKDAALIGIFGLAVPMTVTLIAVGLIQDAAHGPGLGNTNIRNIAVALWGGDSRRYVFPWMAIALITLFGMARFAVRTCASAASPLVKGRKTRLAVLGAALVACAVLSPGQLAISDVTKASTPFAASAAAILSADYLVRRWRVQRDRRVDWLTLFAFFAGWVVSNGFVLWFSPGYEFRLTSSILISYAVSFVVCFMGRTAVAKARTWGA